MSERKTRRNKRTKPLDTTPTSSQNGILGRATKFISELFTPTRAPYPQRRVIEDEEESIQMPNTPMVFTS